MRRFERSIWALVLQVARGASVTDILPVYMSGWGAHLDDDDVAECKTYLHDLGMAGGSFRVVTDGSCVTDRCV